MKLDIYCDGGSRGNPGVSATAFIAKKDGIEFYSESKYLGFATNNVAEYNAVLEALRWLERVDYPKGNISFYLDSQLVVNQLNGLFKIKEKNLIRLSEEIRSLQKKIPHTITFTHITRDKNKIADSLLNKTLDKQTIT